MAAPLHVPVEWEIEMNFMIDSVDEQSSPPRCMHALPGMVVKLDDYYDPMIQGVDVLLGRHLGAGGFANVFVGVTIPKGEVAEGSGVLGTEVAVKVFNIDRPGVTAELLQHLADKEETTMVWLREQEFVVKVLASGHLADDRLATTDPQVHTTDHTASAPAKCLVLEMMSNTLASYLDYAVRVNECDAKPVVRQIAQQLAVLHSGQLDGRQLVHGDIKPENILMRLNGCIAISDFGACKIAHVGSGVDSAVSDEADSGIVFVTPYYAAPELYYVAETANMRDAVVERYDVESIHQSVSQVEHEQGALVMDSSQDIFSLGVVLARMLIGPLNGLFADKPEDIASARAWESLLAQIVDRVVTLPGKLKLSDDALEFIGCACGVGATMEAAECAGHSKRFCAEELLTLSWLQ